MTRRSTTGARAYRGLDRFEARKRPSSPDGLAPGCWPKIDAHTLRVPRGDRSGVVIEPYLTDQWYVDAREMARPAIAAVESGAIQFVPKQWENTYFAWMRDIQDWCISRQLWWGHRIPAWYDESGHFYVGASEAEVRADNALADDTVLRQDEDVLDTWFSSALGPFPPWAGRRKHRSWRPSTRPRYSSPASISFSSGWPG